MLSIHIKGKEIDLSIGNGSRFRAWKRRELDGWLGGVVGTTNKIIKSRSTRSEFFVGRVLVSTRVGPPPSLYSPLLPFFFLSHKYFIRSRIQTLKISLSYEIKIKFLYLSFVIVLSFFFFFQYIPFDCKDINRCSIFRAWFLVSFQSKNRGESWKWR